jgi:hypothetical protein
MHLRRLIAALLFVPLVLFACGDDDDEKDETCAVGDNTSCRDGLECQAVAGGDPKCFCSIDSSAGCDANKNLFCEATADGNNGCYAPLWVKGRVLDLETKSPIEGARVVARNANNAAESGVAVTNGAGEYSLRVAAKRNADGTPAEDVAAITLRADAAGYLTFPTPPRTALAVELKTATGDPLTIETAATDIWLLHLDDAAGLGTIRGRVDAKAPRGTLIVAGGSVNTGGGVTGIADFDGSFAVFNVPVGSVAVHGYKAGLQLASTTVEVKAGTTTSDVILHAIDRATSTIEGKVEIVNPGKGKETSVILAVDETFNPTAIHGEAPPGLRAYPVLGAFTISGVPDGNYVVLAAFENDFLVRDPSSIGGTDIVRITVAGDQVLQQSFKVTGSLDDVSPDAEEIVTGTPVFKWRDDSSEDRYEVQVFNALGEKIWEDLNVPSFSGAPHVAQVTYAGPALEPGMIYQFRATSMAKGVPISQTEDLRGTFRYQ